jgi:hypothetical protein
MTRSKAHLSGIVLALLVAAGPAANPARADVTFYSDITNFSGFGFAQGSGSSGTVGSITSTLQADDITPIAGAAGQSVNAVEFSVANFNTTAVTATAMVRFFAADGSGGGPGTLIGQFDFSPTSFGGGVQLLNFDPGTAIFTIPAGGTFWAGIAFSDSDGNGGSTGATAAELNELGQGIFAPPTIGSSQDEFFQSTSNGTFTTNNPAGSLEFFGGNPTADFGWAFQALAVPEPSSVALFGIGGAIAGVVSLRRRRASRAA